MGAPLKLLVAGHTNVGKTSLMRTLGRNATFGEVANAPGTTQHVERLTLGDATPLLELFDSPGLEDAMALREYVDELAQTHGLEHWQGVEKVQTFLKTTRAEHDFQQEAKVLRQLLNSDAVFFVVDVRTPVLQKYFDEIDLLKLCNKPILPVLNFTHGQEVQEQRWRAELKRVALHSVVAFDACAPPVMGEFHLYDTLSTLLSEHHTVIGEWKQTLQQQAEQRWQTASEYVAELLINAAAYRLEVLPNEAAKALEKLQAKVRQAETKTIKHLLTLYGFTNSELQEEFTAQVDGRWQQDLFHPATLQLVGVKTTKGAATGAAIGAGVDLTLGGMSLGAGTAIGAALGAGAQTWRNYGSRVEAWWKGKKILTLDDAYLRAIILRLYRLIGVLNRRGHGAQAPIVLPEDAELSWQQKKLPQPIDKARAQPQWCAWEHRGVAKDSKRQAQLFMLAHQLQYEFKDLQPFTV